MPALGVSGQKRAVVATTSSAAYAIIVETVGRRSGKRYEVPVGFLEEDGKLIVVAEDGLAASWVGNALDREGRLRGFFRGHGARPSGASVRRPRGLPTTNEPDSRCLGADGVLHARTRRDHARVVASWEVIDLPSQAPPTPVRWVLSLHGADLTAHNNHGRTAKSHIKTTRGSARRASRT
jgi:hypothetical protein